MARLVLALAPPVVLVLVGACYAPTTAPDCVVQCGANDSCPDGLSCVASTCRTDGETTACGVVGERCGIGGCEADETCETCPADCGSCEPHCGSLRLQSDQFDATTGPLWTPVTVGPGSAAEANEQLVLAPGSGDGVAAYLSGLFHDLREGRVMIEVDRMVDPSTDAIAQLLVGLADGGVLAISQTHGELSLGFASPLVTLPYDPIVHRFWRIRGHDGFVSWETSPDATAWTVHASVKSPYNLQYARIYPFAIGNKAASPGVFQIARLVGGDGSLGYCRASALDLGFVQKVPGVLDVIPVGDCTVTVSNNELLLRAQGVNAICYANLAVAYDIRNGGSITFEIAESTTNDQPDVGHRITLIHDSQSSVTLAHAGNGWGTELVENGMSNPKILMNPYDPAVKLWRMREQSGMIVMEVSVDGTMWTTLDTRPWSDEKAARTWLGVASSRMNGTPGDFRIKRIYGQ